MGKQFIKKLKIMIHDLSTKEVQKPNIEDFDLQPESTGEINLNETQTFKLNISE